MLIKYPVTFTAGIYFTLPLQLCISQFDEEPLWKTSYHLTHLQIASLSCPMPSWTSPLSSSQAASSTKPVLKFINV